jgi:predicted dehydrogenase
MSASARTLRVAVIGAGMAGQAHAFGFRNASMSDALAGTRVELARIVDAHLPAAEAAASRYGFTSFGDDVQSVIDDPSIDIVSVALPNGQHREVLLPLIASGKHIFTEKPLGVSLREAAEIADFAARFPAVHGVGFSYRHIPALAALAREVQSGTIGEPYHFEVVYYASHAADPTVPYTWRFDVDRSGGGALIDLGIHCIDTVRFVVGEIDEVVSGVMTTVIDRRNDRGTAEEVTNDDVTAAVLRSGRAVGTFITSRVARGEPNRLTIAVYGAKGSGGFSTDRYDEFWLYQATDPEPAVDGPRRVVAGPAHPYYADVSSFRSRGVGTGYGEAFVAEMQDFLRAIVEDRQLEADFSAAVASMRVADEIIEKAGARRPRRDDRSVDADADAA